MIELDLLPTELKKVQRPKRDLKLELKKLGPQVFKMGGIFLGILLALHLVLGFAVLLKGASLKRLNSRWQLLKSQGTEIEDLNTKMKAAKKVVLPVRQLIEGRIYWSRKLNQLSDRMTPGIWLTGLTVNTQGSSDRKSGYGGSVHLQGYAAALYGDETALVGEFIKALQEDEEFIRSFDSVELNSMTRETLAGNAVMNFGVSLSLRGD